MTDQDSILMEGSPHRRKSSRKSWVDQSPVDPMTDIAREETLLLTHFTKKPTICFGKVKVGKIINRKLYISNPHDYDQGVIIEKFPHDHFFTVDKMEFVVPGESTMSLKLTWTPENEGGCRQMVRFLVDDSYRLQAVLYGTADLPRQKKVAKRGLMSKSVKKPFSVLHTPNLANLKTYNTSTEREMVLETTNVRRALLPSKSKENRQPPVKKSSTAMTKSPPRILKSKSENRIRNRSEECEIPPVSKPKSADPEPKVKSSVKELYHISQLSNNSPEIVSCVSYDDSPEQYETEYTSVEEHTMVSQYEYTETKFTKQEQVIEHHDLTANQWKVESEETVKIESHDFMTETESFDYSLRKRQKQSPKESADDLSPRRETYLVKKKNASQRRRSWRNRMSSPTVRATIPELVNNATTFVPPFTPNAEAGAAPVNPDVSVLSQNFQSISPIQKRSARNVTFQSGESCKSSTLVQSLSDCSVLSSCNSKERLQEKPAVMIDQTVKSEISPKSDESMSTDSLNSKNSSASSVEALLTGKVDSATEKAIKASASLIYDFQQVHATPALPEKPNPQHGRRSTHVVKEPKIVCGQGKLKQKQLFSKGLGTTPSHDASYIRPIDEMKELPGPKQTPSSHDASLARPIDDTTDFPAPKRPQVKTSSAVRNSVSSRVRAAQKAVRMTNREQLSQSVHEQLPRTSEKPKSSYLTRSARSSVRSMKKTEILKSATKSCYSPKKCGVAQSRLVLGKREKTVIPKHPMPFASKNIYYDERWMQKEEWSFTHWFNFILTPVEDYKLRNCPRVDAGSLVFNCKKDYHLAPSKEVLSFEAYAARRRLNRLRKLACQMFQSPDIVKVVRKVEVEIDSQRLVVRKDRPIHADIGLKQNILNWILSYNPLWLRIGLEMVYGEVLLIESNTDILGLSKFIITRLVGNPDIAYQFAHPTVPHLYREGYQSALAKHTLKKFLILVYFLDYAKRHRLIEHDPCLFCKDSEIKASRDFLLNISRDFLSGEGDVTRHLSYFGYVVSYVQTPLDEFDYAVTNLATDLRDGVRLTRVVEVLTGKWGLTKCLRAPAISRLQKVHNLEKVLKALTDHGMNLDLEKGKICAKDIVDGHREKTLTLLWRIVTEFQVDILLDYKELEDEIACLDRRLKRKIQIWKAAGQKSIFETHSRRSSVDLNKFENAKHRLLFSWCQSVCAHYGLKIENFTVSFSDGRVLCFLIHHYYPGLLPLSEIRQKTTVTYMNECESQQQDSDNSFEYLATSLNCSPRTGKPKIYQELLANEAENFKLIAVKVSQIGGVPTMLRHSDMSNTIPDEKVVITYVTYLAIRLLEIRHESRAAIIIQLAWRKYQLRKKQRLLKLKVKSNTPILNNAEILSYQDTHTPEQSSPLRQRTPTSIKTAIIPLSENSGDRHIGRSINDYSPIRPVDMEPLPVGAKKGKVLDTILESSTVEGSISHKLGSDGPFLVDDHKDISLDPKTDDTEAHDDVNVSKKLNKTVNLSDGTIRGDENTAKLQNSSQDKEVSLVRPCSDATAKNLSDIPMDPRKVLSPHYGNNYSPIKPANWEPLNSKRGKFLDTILESSTVENSISHRRGSQESVGPFLADKDISLCNKTDNIEAGDNMDIAPKLNQTIDLTDGIVKGHEQSASLQTPSQAGDALLNGQRGDLSSRRLSKNSTDSRRSSAQLNKTIDLEDGSLLSKSELPKASPALRNETFDSDSSVLQSDLPNIVSSKVGINQTFDGETCPKKSNSQSIHPESKQIQNETFEKICLQGSELEPTRPNSKHNETFDNKSNPDGFELATKSADGQGNETFDSKLSRPELQNVLPSIDDHDQANFNGTFEGGLQGSNVAAMSGAESGPKQHQATKSPSENAQENEFLSEVDGEYKAPEQPLFHNEEMASNKRQSCGSDVPTRQPVLNQTIEFDDGSQGSISGGHAGMDKSFDHTQQNMINGELKPSVVDGQVLDSQEEDDRIGNSELNKTTECESEEAVESQSLGDDDDDILNNSYVCQVQYQSVSFSKVNKTPKEDDADTSNESFVCELQNESVSFCKLNRTAELEKSYSGSPSLNKQSGENGGHVGNGGHVENGLDIPCTVDTVQNGLTDECDGAVSSEIMQQQSVSFCKLNRTAELEKSYSGSPSLNKQSGEDGGHVGNGLDIPCTVDPVQNGFTDECDGAVSSENMQQKSALGEGDEEWFEEEFTLKMSRARTKEMIADRESPEPCIGHKDSSSEKAVEIIQKAFRRYAARNRYLRLKNSAIAIQRLYRCKRETRKAREDFESLKAATVVIQSTVRAYQERKWFLQKKKSILSLQQRRRALLAMRSERSEYLAKKMATKTIQRWYRSLTEMRKTREEFQRSRNAAVKIQSFMRMKSRQREFLQKKGAAISIQNWYRYLKMMHEAKENYGKVRKATLQIQALFRAQRRRKQFLLERNSAVQIQKSFRMFAARKRYLDFRNSAITIQQWYRCQIEMKKAHQNYQRVKAATLVIQSTVRSHLTRKRFLRMKQCAISLQQRRRGLVLTRSTRAAYLGQKEAIIIIQKWYRAVTKMRKARDDFLNTREAIIRIQSIVRQKNREREFLRKKNAALCIQNWFHAILLMKDQRHRFISLRNAAIQIQASFRGLRQRKVYLTQRESALKIQSKYREFSARKRYQCYRNSAIKIQQWYRSMLEMRKARKDFLSLRAATLVIQSNVKAYQVRKRFLQKKKCVVSMQQRRRAVMAMRTARTEYLAKRCATKTIQRWYRSLKEMQNVRGDFEKTRNAVVKIQSFVRMRKQQKEFQNTRNAVVKIQSFVRMRKQQKEFLNTRNAVVKIQSFVRMRKQQKDFQNTRNAAVKIQSLVRMQNQQKEFQKTKEAAIRIQKWYRSLKMMQEARESYISVRKAAILIQALFRARKQRKQFKLEKESAIKIQEWYRSISKMRLARTSFLSAKSSAIRIQRAYKAYCLMKAERTRYLYVRSAIIKLQSQTRKMLVRREFVKQRNSAIIIQKWYRSIKQMVKERNAYHSKRSAAIKIQSAFKGSFQRRIYLKERRSVICAQSVVRMWIERRRWLAMKSAAIMIQRNYKSRLALRRLRETIVKRHEAATFIQIWFRQKLIAQKRQLKIVCDCCSAASIMKTKKFAEIWLEKTRRRKLNAVCLLQKYWRKWFEYRRSAATKIQSVVRGWLVRQRLAKQTSAAVVIQKSVRCWHARRSFQKTKQATHLLQPVIRGWLVRWQIKKWHLAATSIQSFWRGYKIRCSAKNHHVTTLRKRLVDVTKKATVDKKLSNRFALGFDHLMKYKQLSEVLQALVNLEVACRLSPVCCVQLAEGNAAPVIFTIIRGCNRSVPHMELIKYSLQILLNLAKYAPTIEAVYDSRPDAIDIILNVLMVFREKGLIFSKTCILLGVIALDMQEKGKLDDLLLKPQFKEKIMSLYKLTERKYKREETRITTRARMVAVKDSAVFSEFCMSKIGPDWLLGKKILREITEPLNAMSYLLYCLNLQTDTTPNPQKKTRSTKR